MADQRAMIEVSAPSVEEAIENGLAELGLTQEEVVIEIVEAGSKGLFGLGSRNARVKLITKEIEQTSPSGGETILENIELEASEDLELYSEPDFVEGQLLPDEQAKSLDRDQEHILRVSADIVRDLLDSMGIQAQVSAKYLEPDDEQSKSPVWVDVHGKDLSILIGPRAETLTALQYIAGLIINKELGGSVPLIVDVEGYRARRVNQLRQLARRMADQAVKTGRRQTLEPMPASDRRIIHIELRDDPNVTTESVGEEPRRKVTIIPKSP